MKVSYLTFISRLSPWVQADLVFKPQKLLPNGADTDAGMRSGVGGVIEDFLYAAMGPKPAPFT